MSWAKTKRRTSSHTLPALTRLQTLRRARLTKMTPKRTFCEVSFCTSEGENSESKRSLSAAPSAGEVMPEDTSSVQRWFFQCDIAGFVDFSPTIRLLNPGCVCLCPLRVSLLLQMRSLGLRSWLSGVVPCACQAVV